MGFFGKLFGKKDDFLGESPPDFSQPSGEEKGGQDPFGGSPYGQEPLQNSDPFGEQNAAFGGQGPGSPQRSEPGSPFSHDIFSSETPTNADNARNYAASLGGSQQGQSAGYPQQGQPAYAGALTGHEAQLILERLDTIKAELDSIKQRMMRVERYMDAAEMKAGQRKYF